MKLYSENDSYKIYNGDMLDMLQVIKPESIDAIVCDPPYELGFMNKSWDSTGIAFKKETWQNCFEVLKPGGYLLAFGGSRTYHRIACAIEDAGFEIRDCVMYLYGCYSSDTQVLTNEGWKYFYELNKTEKVLQWDKDNDKLSWIKPLNYFEYNIDDELILLQNRHTEQLITKNHKVVCDIKKDHKQYHNKYDYIEAQKILKSDFVKLPLASYYYGSLHYKYAYIIGWFLTDAWIHKDGKAVCFSQSKKDKLVKLKNELERLKEKGLCKYSEYIRKSKKENVKYSGKVYCLQTETGAFVVRRKGKPFISGNSGFPKSMDIAKALEGKLTLGSSNPKDFKKLNGEQVTRGNWGYATMQLEQGYRNKNYDTEAESETYLGKLEPTTDLAKEWQGWGTCLKPAYEPVIVARKPFKGSVVDNIIKYRVGGLNIDECRVGETGGIKKVNIIKNSGSKICRFGCDGDKIETGEGRFPANVITDGSEEVAKGMPNTTSTPIAEESAMRYFYSAKASKKDRDEGLDAFEERKTTDGCIRTNVETARKFGANSALRKNIHPTCKPTELMQYLVRLVSPKGATILDPFMGSGSTGKAVMFENRERDANYKFVGIELTDEYLPIAQARIEYARDKFKYDLEQEKVTKGKQNIFDFMESEE